VFRFIEAEKANFPIKLMCEVLGVSKAGFYAWRRRPLSPRAQHDAVILERIRCIHKDSRQTYGAPRIHFELQDEHGISCSRKRVARLMAAAGIRGCCRRRRHWTTRRDDTAAPAADLLERDFSVDAPNKRWVADITYVRTWEGFLYVSFVLDLFSRRVVGWSMRDDLRPSSCSTRSTWRSRTAGPIRVWCTIQIGDVSTRASRSASVCASRASCLRWDRSATPLTMPQRSRSSPP